MLNKILIIFCQFIIILCAYEIPKPNIFVYPNQGFRVSIPGRDIIYISYFIKLHDCIVYNKLNKTINYKTI